MFVTKNRFETELDNLITALMAREDSTAKNVFDQLTVIRSHVSGLESTVAELRELLAELQAKKTRTRKPKAPVTEAVEDVK